MDRARRVRSEGPEQAFGTQSRLDVGRHTVGRVLGALDRIPEVMGDELQEQWPARVAYSPPDA